MHTAPTAVGLHALSHAWRDGMLIYKKFISQYENFNSWDSSRLNLMTLTHAADMTWLLHNYAPGTTLWCVPARMQLSLQAWGSGRRLTLHATRPQCMQQTCAGGVSR